MVSPRPEAHHRATRAATAGPRRAPGPTIGAMPRPHLLSPSEADAAYASAQKVVETHRRLAEWLREGQTLAQIDRFVAATLQDLRCRSCFLGYKVRGSPSFPSHACLSVNDCVVHGTAGYYTAPM